MIAVTRLAALVALCASAEAAPVLLKQTAQAPQDCGSVYSQPFADPADGQIRRACAAPEPRSYRPRYRGIGYDVLDLESQACFVPDSAYRLLDEIIDAVTARVPAASPGLGDDDRRRLALEIGRVSGDVLASRGFGLYIPTETLGDALVSKSAAGEAPRHTTDCDTSSLIVATASSVLGLPASLVEMTLSSGAGHNFVRWDMADGVSIEWDTNGRQQCRMPPSRFAFQGQSMTRDQTLSYVLTLRAQLWARRFEWVKSVEDNAEAIRLFPEHPHAYNNFAWTVATKVFSERASLADTARQHAERLLAIQRTANHLDTAACIHALNGNFTRAIELQTEAVQASGRDEAFVKRLEGFKATLPVDCTGAE